MRGAVAVNGAGEGPTLRSSAHRTIRTAGELRLPEFLLFACLIFELEVPGLPVPVNQLVMVAILGLGLLRWEAFELSRYRLVVPTLVVALFYISMISLFAEPTEFAADPWRRFLRLCLTALLIIVVASGRIDLRSASAGLGTGLIANAIAFYAGFAPDEYGGVLSGFFVDKNVAGLSYAVFGVLLLSVVDRRGMKVALALVFGLLVWLTGSRTSITGYAGGLLWILVAPRLPVPGRWGLGGLIYLGVNVLAEDFSHVGQFSDREGSDALRARIDAASEVKVGHSGFFGSGLGEAYVVFDDEPGRIWYFHNSYWSALVEGGWPWLVMLLVLTAVALRPFTRVTDPKEIAVQAAAVATLVCAWRLGEVLFTIPWALVIGYAIAFRAAREGDGQSPTRHPLHRAGAGLKSRR